MKARSLLSQDKIWSKFSNDKVDIGRGLSKVIRTLAKALPLNHPMRALSIGSSNEPQFRILQAAFTEGLYLQDIDRAALKAVEDRVKRQNTANVHTILQNYKEIFMDEEKTRAFVRNSLGGKRVELITLEHSLYYAEESEWPVLFENLYRHVLAKTGAIHAVVMAAESKDRSTTTWLYNHFAGRFCHHKNDQSLPRFVKELRKKDLFRDAQILSATRRVRFFVNDFKNFISVIWMILLYPHVHRYTASQKMTITRFIYRQFFKEKKPLIQLQDHLFLYRGIPFKGLT